MEHLSYPTSSSVQNMGSEFVIGQLRDARTRSNDDRFEDEDRSEDYDRAEDDDRREDESRREDDERREFDDHREDDGRRPPYSPSPRPQRMPTMGSMVDNWKKLWHSS